MAAAAGKVRKRLCGGGRGGEWGWRVHSIKGVGRAKGTAQFLPYDPAHPNPVATLKYKYTVAIKIQIYANPHRTPARPYTMSAPT